MEEHIQRKLFDYYLGINARIKLLWDGEKTLNKMKCLGWQCAFFTYIIK